MGGVVVLPLGAAAAGVSRARYRRAIQRELGGFGVYTTTGTAAGIEARRQIVCSGLVDDFEGLDRLEGRYLYIATGNERGLSTRIRSVGYHGPIGYLELTRPLAAPCPPGIEIEISAALPGGPYLDVKDVNTIVNEALFRTTIESRATFTGNGTRGYSLLDLEALLDRDGRADAVYDRLGEATADPDELVPYTVRVDTTNGSRTLVTGYAYGPSQTFDLRILVAGGSLIHDGAGWAPSSVGLTQEHHAAAVPVPWVTAFGMVQATAALGAGSEAAGEQAVLARRQLSWAQRARAIAASQFPRPTPAPRDGLVVSPTGPGAFR